MSEQKAMANMDAQRRRLLLQALFDGRTHNGDGYLSGRFIAEVIATYWPAAYRAKGDVHVRALCEDLVRFKVADERDDREYEDQTAGDLDVTSYAINMKGIQLIEMQIAPVPGIKDDRIVKGR